MVLVPADEPRLRAWKGLMVHVGLPEDMPMPTVRRVASAGIGISPAKGREIDPVPRPRPPASVMRSERPAPPRAGTMPTSRAKRIWPNLRGS
jgi:hypothetical protein